MFTCHDHITALPVLVLLCPLRHWEIHMDESIRRRIAADDLTHDQADALDSNRASDRNDGDWDRQVLDLNNEKVAASKAEPDAGASVTATPTAPKGS